MPKIYSKAAKVFVWLGPAYDSSDVAIRATTAPSSNWLATGKLLKGMV